MLEDLFTGPARPVPAPLPSSMMVQLVATEPAPGGVGDAQGSPARYADADPSPADTGPVRHAAGYVAFVQALADAGEDPRRLAQDSGALLAALDARPALVNGPDLAEGAVIFFGNTLARANPNAEWRRSPALQLATAARRIDVARVLEAALADSDRRGEFLRGLVAWAEEDVQAELRRQAMEDMMQAEGASGLVPLAVPFMLPATVTQLLLDEAGEPIHYGDRWPDGPPEEAYSRVSHPERFAPLHAVADALVAHLARYCDVVVRVEEEDGERVVHLEPTAGAPIRLRYTTFPGIVLHAGAFWSEAIPTCGCDACDESGSDAVDQLVQDVLAIVAGGLTERYPVGDSAWQVYGLRRLDYASFSGSETPRSDSTVDHDAERLLAALPDGHWPPWPQHPLR